MAAPVNQPVASESIEPRAAKPAVPVWMFILLLLLIYAGMVYFDQASGWFSEQVYGPYHSVAELERWQPATSHGPFDIGRAVYNKPTCVACHQVDGKGTPGQFPPLVKSDWVNEKEPGRLIRIVLNGLSGPLEFQGQTYNGSMVPWKDVLNDEEVAAVLTYVRQNKDWGNNAPEVKPEQVKAVRDKIKERSTPFAPDEVSKINPAE
jgi:Cytochrome c, mono- and diheme variants